jgi:hypothetical protein
MGARRGQANRNRSQRERVRSSRRGIRLLALPALWHDSSTAPTDRQIIVRSLIDRIVVEVLDGTERVSVAIHRAGGFESHYHIRRAVSHFERLEAADNITQRIRELLDEGYRLSDIADRLNREGYCPARGEKYTKTSVGVLCRRLRRLALIPQCPLVKPNYWRRAS